MSSKVLRVGEKSFDESPFCCRPHLRLFRVDCVSIVFIENRYKNKNKNVNKLSLIIGCRIDMNNNTRAHLKTNGQKDRQAQNRSLANFMFF